MKALKKNDSAVYASLMVEPGNKPSVIFAVDDFQWHTRLEYAEDVGYFANLGDYPRAGSTCLNPRYLAEAVRGLPKSGRVEISFGEKEIYMTKKTTLLTLALLIAWPLYADAAWEVSQYYDEMDDVTLYTAHQQGDDPQTWLTYRCAPHSNTSFITGRQDTLVASPYFSLMIGGEHDAGRMSSAYNIRVKVDATIIAMRLSYSWGSESARLKDRAMSGDMSSVERRKRNRCLFKGEGCSSYTPLIERIRQGSRLLVELPQRTGKSEILAFDLTGSRTAIDTARRRCGLTD